MDRWRPRPTPAHEMPGRPVRVLQALTSGGVGGTELMLLQLLSSLDPSRVACDVSFLDGRGPVVERFRTRGAVTHDLGGPPALGRPMWRLVRLMQAVRYDVIHLYGFRMSLVGRVAARLVRPRPAVVHGIRGLHVTEGEEVSSAGTRLALAVERLGSPLVDLYIANSHGAVAFLTERGLPREKFVTIPNGLDLGRWPRPLTRPRRGTPEIVCVANFRPIKRHGDLLRAVARLRARSVPMRCLLVGDGPERPGIETLIRELGVADVVDLVGSRPPDGVLALLQRADVFALSSLWEGMPASVMEAMATGLPVAGTDVPGIRELVVEGVTGYLVPAGHPDALAERLDRLLADPGLREAMGNAGHRRIATEFSLERMVRRYEDAYAAVAARSRPTFQPA